MALIARSFLYKAHGKLQKFVPKHLRDFVHELKIPFMIEYSFDKLLTQYIRKSNYLTEAAVNDAMKKFGLNNRWATINAMFNGKQSNDYIPDGVFYSRIQSKMNNNQHVKACSDKNFYELTPLRDRVIPAVARKVSGRYLDQDYEPIDEMQLKTLLEKAGGDIVIKPAIDSGSGNSVWVGPAAFAFDELKRRRNVKDLVIQKRQHNHEFFRKIAPSSFNTLRVMTCNTGSKHVVLGTVLRVGKGNSVVDNQSAGGIAIGVFDDGRLDYYGWDICFNKFEQHPDTGFVFKDQKVPFFDEINKLCMDMHRYFPHCGIVGWDIAVNDESEIKIVEVNLHWIAISLLQVSHGPIFGPYKDEIKKTYNLPDWEGK